MLLVSVCFCVRACFVVRLRLLFLFCGCVCCGHCVCGCWLALIVWVCVGVVGSCLRLCICVRCCLVSVCCCCVVFGLVVFCVIVLVGLLLLLVVFVVVDYSLLFAYVRLLWFGSRLLLLVCVWFCCGDCGCCWWCVSVVVGS